MKLLNVDEEIPEYFYIFLDFSGTFGFMHENNFNLTKKIFSGAVINSEISIDYRDRYLTGEQQYLPFVLSQNRPSSQTSFSFNVVNDYLLEYNLELYRYAYANKYPSRLSAVYAFGDFETCIKVSNLYNWDINTVKKFKLVRNKLVEDLVRVSKNNMQIISSMRGLDCTNFSKEDQHKIYTHYWNGKGDLKLVKDNKEYNTGEIYEYLVEGILELVEG